MLGNDGARKKELVVFDVLNAVNLSIFIGGWPFVFEARERRLVV